MTNITHNTIDAAIERLDRSLTDTERDMVFETCGAASFYLHINNRKADDATLDMLVAVALYAYRKAISDVQNVVRFESENLTSY